MPLLEDLYDALLAHKNPKAERIANSLVLYVHGSQNYFNHHTNVDSGNRIMCFDIRDLGNQLKELGMLIVQDAVWNRVSQNRERKIATRYYCDEFHLLLKEKQTAIYSVEIWKRFRKWGGIPTGLTQNVGDFLRSEEIEGILGNSDFVYLLNQNAKDQAILADKLGLSDKQLSYVTNSEPGSGLILFDNVVIPFVDKYPTDTKTYRIMNTKRRNRCRRRTQYKMAEKRQKKQAVKAFEKETFSKDKEVTGVKHTEHRQDNTFSVENQFSASEKPVSNLPRDANHGSRTGKATSGHSVQKSEFNTGTEYRKNNKKKYYRQQQQDTSGHNVQKSEAEAEKTFLKENSFINEENGNATNFHTEDADSFQDNYHVRNTYQRSEEKGKYHKRRVQREHAHRERAKSENAKQSDYGDLQTKDATFSQGRRTNLQTKKYRRLLISRKRTAESCRKQRTRCRQSGSMR